MRTAVYLRVSTDQQTTDNQLPDIQGYLKEHYIPESEVEYFSENESAWKQGHQKELKRLMDDIRSGKRKYDRLVIWSFDRLTRGGAAELINLYNFFAQKGIMVISVKEPWSDVPKEFMPVILAFFGMLGEGESRNRSRATRAGMDRVRREGTKSGVGIGKRGKDKTPRRRSGYINRYIGGKRGK